MAITLPDPGNGIPEDKTGNDEWTNMKIIRENFSDSENAASRTVGTASGQVPLAESLNQALRNINKSVPTGSGTDYNQSIGELWYVGGQGENSPHKQAGTSLSGSIKAGMLGGWGGGTYYLQQYFPRLGNKFFYRTFKGGDSSDPDSWEQWVEMYHTGNTTREEDTGYLVASSPVLKVQHDSFGKVHESEQLDIDVKNIDVGVYAITGTTGLRENDGWNLKPPKDVNGNVLCICEAEEKDGVITLKTYKKRFDFETVSIVADYDNPTDIPDGATVMLRFNDLPVEHESETGV